MAKKRGEVGQLNIRARPALIAVWREAAECAGYPSLSAWMKDVLNHAALEQFAEEDQRKATSAPLLATSEDP